jgi:predicted dinucleotide-binding enzyme
MFLANAEALVLAGTGPVGQRVAQLLAWEGAAVRVASRTLDRARRRKKPARRPGANQSSTKVAVASAPTSISTSPSHNSSPQTPVTA